MIDRISGVFNESNISRQQTSKRQADFSSVFNETLEKVNQLQKNAEKAASDFALGKISSIHEVIIEAEKATVALRLTNEVRNKIVEAYREIMRMQL